MNSSDSVIITPDTFERTTQTEQKGVVILGSGRSGRWNNTENQYARILRQGVIFGSRLDNLSRVLHSF